MKKRIYSVIYQIKDTVFQKSYKTKNALDSKIKKLPKKLLSFEVVRFDYDKSVFSSDKKNRTCIYPNPIKNYKDLTHNYVKEEIHQIILK